MNWSHALCKRASEDECIRDLRRALHSQGDISSTLRKCVTPDELRDMDDLVEPDLGRVSDLVQPGGFRRQFVRQASPYSLYAHSSLVLLLQPTLASRMFESYWSMMDGFFLGDRDSAEDIKLFSENKVTRVINCAANAIDNHFESMGVSYLNYSWSDDETQIILDDDDMVADEVYNFIEEAVDRCEGILVQSFRGQSRSCVVLAAYCMKKYKWNLHNTLQYLSFKCPVLNPGDSFLSQLEAYEIRLVLNEPTSYHNSISDDTESSGGSWDASVLSNTYTNCQRPPLSDMQIIKTVASSNKTHVVSFSEDSADIKPYEVSSPLDVGRCDVENQKPWRVPVGTQPLKSALKSAKNKGKAVAEECHVESELITIHRRSGPVSCNPDEIVPKRFGVQLHNKTILLEYAVPRLGLRAHHSMIVELNGPKAARNMSTLEADDYCNTAIASELKLQHAPWLAIVSVEQLAALVGRLRVTEKEQKLCQKKKEPQRRKRVPGRSPR